MLFTLLLHWYLTLLLLKGDKLVFIYYLLSLVHYLLDFGKSPKPERLLTANSK